MSDTERPASNRSRALYNYAFLCMGGKTSANILPASWQKVTCLQFVNILRTLSNVAWQLVKTFKMSTH